MPIIRRSTGNRHIDALIARELRYGQTRWAEVWLASLMTAVGVALLWPGHTFGLASFKVISQIVAEDVAGWVAIFVGGARLISLYINGSMRNTPIIRWVGAAGGFMFWSSWAIGFTFTAPPVVPLFPMSIVMAVAELHALGRITRDAFAYDSLGIRRWRHKYARHH